MVGKTRTRGLLIGFLWAAGSISSGHAFTLGYSETVRGWEGNEITLEVNYTGCTITAERLDMLIDQAMSVWNAAPGSRITLKRGGSTTNSGKAAKTPAFIACETNFTAVTGQHGNSVVGTGFASPSTGDTLDQGYLLLNAETGMAAEISRLSDAVLVIVLAHEIGHVLGLGHSSEPRALMYYRVSGKNQLRLAQDDIDGIHYLYPREEIGTNGIFGCGSLQPLGSGQPPGGGGGPVPPGALEMIILLGFCVVIAYGFPGRWKRSTGLKSTV